jgi:hypothetical protein
VTISKNYIRTNRTKRKNVVDIVLKADVYSFRPVSFLISAIVEYVIEVSRKKSRVAEIEYNFEGSTHKSCQETRDSFFK